MHMKKILLLIATILVIAMPLSACGSRFNIEGTWVLAENGAGMFETITFRANDGINIPGITMTLPGVSWVYTLTDDEIILYSSGGGARMEAMRFDFEREGDSIFIEGAKYVRR
jgi:hypothetical protein